MYVQLGDTIILPFNTSDATGQSVAADSTPTIVIAVNGTGVIAYSPTVTHVSLGDYYATIAVTTGNGFAIGQACGVWVHATVGGVAGSAGVETFRVGPTPVDLSSLPTNTSIAAAVLDAARSSHIVAGSIGEGVAIAAALAQGNYFMDQVDNTNPNGQTSCRIRCFHTGAAASAATENGTGEGEFATFVLTTNYIGPNKIKTHRGVQQ